MADNNEHQAQIEERKKYTDLILNSTAKNKVVIAGAGTGKSFTFKSLLTTKGNNSLALTFINNLAGDLAKDLSELADVYTFHGYCKSLLHKISVDGIEKNFNYYPLLPQIITTDASILASHLSKFEEAIQKLEEDERIEFYLKRANYYNAVGHNDSVYRVLKYFMANNSLIPKFAQIVVDEYQDFNPLEVEFIELLSIPSPVLIAGDDDQAIYGFKHASPVHIRNKAIDKEYELFELPYCSRCTQVIINSVINVTNKAKELGFLKNRIDKNYICFMPEKGKDSGIYPKIIYASCSIQNKADARNYIGKFIESEIKKIPQEEIKLARSNNYPCVLILCQSQYLKQIYGYLESRFPDVDFTERKDDDIDKIEGYRILIRDKNSNLGWRIILEFESDDLKRSIINSSQTTNSNIANLLEPEFITRHLDVVSILSKIVNEEDVTEGETNSLKAVLNLTLEEVKVIFHKIVEDEEKSIDDGSPTIKLSTINGSKGMSGGYVFIINMNDGDFPKNPRVPTDNEICQLVVALTRTRKQCYLVANKRFGLKYGIKQSSFISWIDQNNIKKIVVDANYVRNLTSQ